MAMKAKKQGSSLSSWFGGSSAKPSTRELEEERELEETAAKKNTTMRMRYLYQVEEFTADIVGYGKSFESQINVYNAYKYGLLYSKTYDLKLMKKNTMSKFDWQTRDEMGLDIDSVTNSTKFDATQLLWKSVGAAKEKYGSKIKSVEAFLPSVGKAIGS